MKKNLQVFWSICLVLVFALPVFAQDVSLETLQVTVKQCEDDAITIDGLADEEVWQHIPAIKLENYIDGFYDNHPDPSDLSATMKLTWNEFGLYAFIEVKDQSMTLRADHEDWAQHEVDNVEAFFQIPNAWGDALRTEGGRYNTGSWQVRTMVGEEESFGGRENSGWALESGEMLAGQIKWNMDVEGGYNLEIAYPWEMLFQYVDTEPLDLFAEEKTIGFELTVADADNGEKRKGILAWNDNINANLAWRDPEFFGEIILSHDLIATSIKSIQKNFTRVYPNPASSSLHVEGNISSIEIFDLLGRSLFYEKNLKETLITIDTSFLKHGIYLLNINHGEQIEKIIIK